MTAPAGVCRFCGCTERDACGYGVDRARPYLCYWTDRTFTVCSLCAPAAKAERRAFETLQRAGYRSVRPSVAAPLDFVEAFHRGFVVGWFAITARSRYGRNPYQPKGRRRIVQPRALDAWDLGQRSGAEASRAYQRTCGPLVNAPRRSVLQSPRP